VNVQMFMVVVLWLAGLVAGLVVVVVPIVVYTKQVRLSYFYSFSRFVRIMWAKTMMRRAKKGGV
jgi:hypothetical protein